MHLTIFLITLGVAVVTHAYQNLATAKGLRFLGVGYNILKGNPEGGKLSHGGVDPGLLSTRKILKLTWDTKKTSVDGKFRVPDEVLFVHRSSCVEFTTNEVFSGAKSYQDKLKIDVKASADYDAGLWNVAFSLSSNYGSIKHETTREHKVFFEKKKVCNEGTARYLLELAQVDKYSVTEAFAAAVCRLPKVYDQRAYRIFIDSWGTDIVVKVTLGTKKIERHESSYTKIVKFAMEKKESSLSASGSLLGFSSSLSVDIKKFSESNTDTASFTENRMVFSSGGHNLPEPIGLQLMPIDNAVEDSFFRVLDQRYRCRGLAQRRSNVKRILREYPRIKGASKPQDPDVRIPLTWPVGTYGLPMTKSGCPKGTFWHKGTRYHDTEDNASNNYWSNPYDLAGHVSKSNMEQKFCMKTRAETSKYNLPWPKGQYCIYKKGNCPQGFRDGYIYWDDEDDNNNNWRSGQLPDGSYDRNTNIYYCCRDDGYATKAIYLPIDTPFVLLKSGNRHCQNVHGVNTREEFFRWDSEDDSPHAMAKGKHPFLEYLGNKNLKVHYCYYY